MSRIITNSSNDDYNKAIKSFSMNQRYANYENTNRSGMMKTSIVEKNGLPKNIQRKMTGAATANTKMSNPTFYHPLYESTNMMLPRDRRERNEWCRHFYRTEPIIATSLDLHTEFPISDFNNICSDDYIKKFFDYMAFDKINIIDLLLNIGLEYWKIGDVFPFGQINESEGMWERFAVLNPDFINVESSIFAEDPMIELIPDQKLRDVVSGGPSGPYGEIYMQLPEDVIRQIKMNRNIRLDNRLVSHIAHKAAPYETWGTPIMMRCFKTLIYKDKLRSAQDAIANRHIMPLRVAKIGAPGEPMPSQEDIDSFRDTLLEADGDPNYFLVYHYGLQFDYVGSSGKILPLNQEFDFIQKELMNALGINQAMLNGEGPTYANAQVGFDTLAHRYMSYRLRLENWIRQKVYRPISEIQGFYKPLVGEINPKYMTAKQKAISAARKDLELIVPTINWKQQDLTGNQSIMSFVQQLQQKGLISMSTVLPMINLDPETEKKNLEVERGTVFDPNKPPTGPLQNEGRPLGTNTDKKIKNTEESEPKIPSAPPGGKSTEDSSNKGKPSGPKENANPEDFGFPKETSLNSDDFFVRGKVETGDSLCKTRKL